MKVKNCLECGKKFMVTNPSQNAQKYCSAKCRLKHNKKHTRISIKKCAYCGKEYVATHTRHVRKFCSNKCAYHSKLDSNLKSVRKYQKAYTLPTGQAWLGNSNLKSHLRNEGDWDKELREIHNELTRLKLSKWVKH